MLLGQLARLRAHLVGQQDLSTGWRPETVLGDLEAALVGDLEPANLFDAVAPELHSQRMLFGWWEHVDDPATHGELPASLDHVHPGVRDTREPAYDVVEVGLVAHPQLERLQVTEPWDLRLQHAAHRRHDHAHRPAGRVIGPRMAQASQHSEPTADGVGSR